MRQLSDYGWTAHDITTSSGDEYYNYGFSMRGFALLLLAIVLLNTNRLFVNDLQTQIIGITFDVFVAIPHATLSASTIFAPISPALEPHELPVVSREASDASWEASDESWCRAQTVPHELLADPRPDPDLGPDPDQVLGTDAAARAALRRRGHPRRRGRHRETAREHARSECGGERAGDAARPECGNPNLNPKPNLNPNPNRAGDAARPECGRDARLVA